MANKTRIISVTEAEISLSDHCWSFVQVHATQIEAHWHRRTAEQPTLFNGDILLLHNWSCVDGRFHGQCLITEFKSFLYWRDHKRQIMPLPTFFLPPPCTAKKAGCSSAVWAAIIQAPGGFIYRAVHSIQTIFTMERLTSTATFFVKLERRPDLHLIEQNWGHPF